MPPAAILLIHRSPILSATLSLQSKGYGDHRRAKALHLFLHNISSCGVLQAGNSMPVLRSRTIRVRVQICPLGKRIEFGC